MTTFLYSHSACLAHDPGSYHPECPGRLEAVLQRLGAPEFAALERREAERDEAAPAPKEAGIPALMFLTMAGAKSVLPLSAIERIDVDEHTRYGLTSRTLELEAGELFLVLGKRTLGADPRDVADVLARLRYTGPGRS